MTENQDSPDDAVEPKAEHDIEQQKPDDAEQAADPIKSTEPTPKSEAVKPAPTKERKKKTKRPTVRELQRFWGNGDPSDTEIKMENRDNEQTRLPQDESVHIGAFMLAEAFTSSTVATLYDKLEKKNWPYEQTPWDPAKRLLRNRSGLAGGWQRLGHAQKPDKKAIGGTTDSSLPECVDAVWINLHYTTPSLAIVVATFTISPESGNLSTHLRADYKNDRSELKIRVRGFAGRIRSHIPWSRPRRIYYQGVEFGARAAKKRTLDELLASYELACHEWLSKEYRGRFAKEKWNTRPSARVFFTETNQILDERHEWLDAVELNHEFHSWQSYSPTGWTLVEKSSFDQEYKNRIILGARRQDVARDKQHGDLTNWVLSQHFHDSHSPLIAKFTMIALLDLYSDRLRAIRDQAQVHTHPRRPVKEAKNLDRYLLGDGLDAASIIEDTLDITSDIERFRWEVPEYREYVPECAPLKSREPYDLLPELCATTRERASKLKTYTNAITANFRASTELRQAITNARLQRAAAILAVVATVAAVIALFAT